MARTRNQMVQLLWPHLISTSYGRPIEQYDEDEDYGPGEVEEEDDPDAEEDGEDGPDEAEENDDMPAPKTGLITLGNIGQFGVGAVSKAPSKPSAPPALHIATSRGSAGAMQTSNDIQAVIRQAGQQAGLSLWVDTDHERPGVLIVRFAGQKPTAEDVGKLLAALDDGMEWWTDAIEGNSILTVARITPLFEGRRLLGVEVAYTVKNS